MGLFFDEAWRSRLLASMGHAPRAWDQVRSGEMASLDDVECNLRHDFSMGLPEDMLAKVDRMSMLTSLEMRTPLLANAVVDFMAVSVPSHLKVTKAKRKILLGMAARHLLPDSFDFERKQGFSVPPETLLALCDGRVPGWTGLLGAQARGLGSQRAFQLAIFDAWVKVHGITL